MGTSAREAVSALVASLSELGAGAELAFSFDGQVFHNQVEGLRCEQDERSVRVMTKEWASTYELCEVCSWEDLEFRDQGSAERAQGKWPATLSARRTAEALVAFERLEGTSEVAGAKELLEVVGELERHASLRMRARKARRGAVEVLLGDVSELLDLLVRRALEEELTRSSALARLAEASSEAWMAFVRASVARAQTDTSWSVVHMTGSASDTLVRQVMTNGTLLGTHAALTLVPTSVLGLVDEEDVREVERVVLPERPSAAVLETLLAVFEPGTDGDVATLAGALAVAQELV
jgi:acyl-CoA-binding protein